ncbi:hypothetical protein ACR6C2_19215 [Streptomyces sp. INA 01156]
MRTQMLAAGYPLSAVTEALCDRWQPGVRLIPMTDDRVETHVAVTLPADDPAEPRRGPRPRPRDPASAGRSTSRSTGYGCGVGPGRGGRAGRRGAGQPAPGVLEAIAGRT